jgi:geranylgeranyl pyrophosphate synthase
MKVNSTVQANVNFKQKPASGGISGISHVVSPAVTQSVQKLDFDLSTWEENPRIGRLLSQTVLSGGKRLRPIVSFLVADFFGVPHSKIAPFARIVELIHAATLAHDDVIDNANFRRGEPSINAVASNKHAVLAGDYLLAYAVDQVALYGRGDLMQCLTRVIRDLAEGEWLQIENSQKAHLARQDIENVALKKTGSVLRWCCEMPPLLLEHPESITRRAAQFGELLGVAFQMTDDILDFKRRDGSEFADLKNGIINSVIYEAMVLSSEIDSPNAACAQELTWDDDLLKRSLANVTELARQKLQDCHRLLAELSELTAEDNIPEQKNAHFALTCLIEYLASRV